MVWLSWAAILERAGPDQTLTGGQVAGIDLLGHISQDATLSLSHLKVVDMVVRLVKEMVRVIQVD